MISEKVIALITARGGSKGLPRKNLRLLSGKPLIAYSIEAALGAKGVKQCIVSTEDPEIKAVSLELGAEVIDRPINLAGDSALSRDVVRHILEKLAASGSLPKRFMLLQPTSPLRNSGHIDACISAFFKGEYRSAISVTEAEHHPYKGFRVDAGQLVPLFGIEYLDRPRQTLPETLRQNGAIYLAETSSFLQQGSFFIPPVMPFLMEPDESIDIDSEQDLQIAEFLLKSRISAHH